MGRADSPLRGKLVFLVGAQRSGTNWLQRILAAHPGVRAVPSETHLFSHGIAPLSERVHHAAADMTRTGAVYMDRDEFLDACRDLCDRLFGGLLERLGPADRLIERTPWHAKHLELIAAVYPDAALIHIVRDGRDVARSLAVQPYGPDTIEGAAAEWRESVEAARSASHLAAYTEVRYEELLADTPGRIPDLLAALGLSADKPTVERMLAEAGVRFNVDPAAPEIGSGKWRSWSPSEYAAFRRAAGKLNRELGYDNDQGPAANAAAPQHPGLRDRVRGWARSLIRFRGRHAPGDEGRRNNARLGRSQEVVEALLEAIHTGAGQRIAELLEPEAEVRWVTRGGEWSERGVAASARLAGALAKDPAFSWTQRRGEVHLAIPSTTVVLGYASGAKTAERTLVAEVAGRSVSRLTIYALD